MHPPTIYFPLIVPEALMIEPTETETKETLDAFAEAMREIAREAAESPDVLKEAPHGRPVRRLDEVRAAKQPILRHAFDGPWVLGLVLAFVASFALAMGPVVWVVLSEIFPTRVRGRAMSIATLCLWAACYLVSQTFPVLLARLAGAVFFVYAAMCAAAFAFIWLAVPETKGRALEDIEALWAPEVKP
jgi:hypothetical protein